MKPRKQRRRRDFIILSFGVPTALLSRIDAAVAEHRKNSRGPAMNRSEWLRRAIERDLAHRDRSRGRGKKLGVSTEKPFYDPDVPPPTNESDPIEGL